MKPFFKYAITVTCSIFVVLLLSGVYKFGKKCLPDSTAWKLVQEQPSFKAFLNAKQKLEKKEGFKIPPYKTWITQQYKATSLFEEPKIYLADGYCFFMKKENGKWICYKIKQKDE